MSVLTPLVNALRPFPFPGKTRLFGPFVPMSGEREARLFGSSVVLDLSDPIQRLIYLGDFEPAETDMVRRTLKPGMTFVDAGANCGYFTLLAASLVGLSGSVLAFEPHAPTRMRLETAVTQNRLKQVRVFGCGLGETDGTVQLFSAAGGCPSMIWGEGEPESVEVRALDGLIGGHTVDLLKIDVEGYEPHVIDGATRAISEGRVKALLIEFNDKALQKVNTSAAEFHARLIGMGYRDEDSRPVCGEIWLENRLLTREG